MKLQNSEERSQEIKFTIERKAFVQALNFSLGIIEKRNVINELNNIKLSLAGNMLNIGATDIDLYLNQNIGAEVIKEGVITVCAQTLKDVVQNMSDETISLHYNPEIDRLKVTAKNCKFDLVTLPAQRFPIMEKVDSDIVVEISSNDFITLLDYTKFAMSKEETRYTLNGVYLHSNEGDLCAAATDCHRLSFASVKLSEAISDNFGAIVPRKTVNEVLRMIKDSKALDRSVKLSFGQGRIKFEFDNVILVSKIIDGKFPDYENFIPEDNSCKLIISNALISSSINRVAAITSGLSKAIKISFDNTKSLVAIDAAGEARGIANEVIEFSDDKKSYCHYSGDDIISGFNPDYIQDVLSAVSSHGNSDLVEMHFQDSTSPLLIKKNDGSRDCFVIMPVKV